MDQQTLIFLGPQGSGKGTQSKIFEDTLKRIDPLREVVHFEMGKNLRELANKESYTGKLLSEVIYQGELVPFNISSCVFSNHLVEHLTSDCHLIIDGFPRSEEQMPVVDTTMAFYKRVQVTVLYIDIPDEEGVERLLKRARADDTEKNIRKRLAWTREEWGKILARFDANPIYKVVEINGVQSVEEVHREILSKLGLS